MLEWIFIDKLKCDMDGWNGIGKHEQLGLLWYT